LHGSNKYSTALTASHAAPINLPALRDFTEAVDYFAHRPVKNPQRV
jgi:hypothetical protein